MIIKEYKLVSAEEDGTFPKLQVIHEYDYDPECDFYVYYTGNKNYELEYFFFGEQLELQNNYVEHFYILSYNETGNIIGIMKLSSGSRKGTTLPYDALFTYLLLTGSYSFITIHNHPNNYDQLSQEDIQTDHQLEYIANLLNINYRAGLIITKKQLSELYKKAYETEKDLFDEDDCLYIEDNSRSERNEEKEEN